MIKVIEQSLKEKIDFLNSTILEISDSKEIKKNLNIFLYYYASESDIEMIDFILKDKVYSQYINIHENKDIFFKTSCKELKILNYLIVVYEIEKTAEINFYLKTTENLSIKELDKINSLFEKRELRNKLNKDLLKSKVHETKNKI